MVSRRKLVNFIIHRKSLLKLLSRMVKDRKSLPVRRCLICGKRDLQKNLVRIFNSNGVITLDYNRTGGGRGAYFHPDCVSETGLWPIKRVVYGLRLSNHNKSTIQSDLRVCSEQLFALIGD